MNTDKKTMKSFMKVIFRTEYYAMQWRTGIPACLLDRQGCLSYHRLFLFLFAFATTLRLLKITQIVKPKLQYES
ncbi:MAG TPA: hypothetical protein PLX69_13870 [Leptospiraceae bacterium]|nr:hypothetical protein [Leptospiraceae bacterium]HRG75644.1 hypothetical protein [Leptospiraceae bacterium]